MDLIIIAVFAGLAFLGLAADRWGVDSRPIETDSRYPVSAGLG